MRIVLRIIAVLAGVAVVATLLFILQFGARGFEALLATGTLGVMTIAGWVVTILAGPLAAIQLFRLRSSGRIAGIVLFGTMLAYYGAGLLGLRSGDAPVGPIITACVFFAVIVAVLLSSSARNVCVEEAVTRELRRA